MVVVCLSVTHKQSGLVGRCRGHRHVFEGDVIGSIDFDGAVVGVAGVACHHNLLVVGAHTSENHAVGR